VTGTNFRHADFGDVPNFDQERTARQRAVKVTHVDLVVTCIAYTTFFVENKLYKVMSGRTNGLRLLLLLKRGVYQLIVLFDKANKPEHKEKKRNT